MIQIRNMTMQGHHDRRHSVLKGKREHQWLDILVHEECSSENKNTSSVLLVSVCRSDFFSNTRFSRSGAISLFLVGNIFEVLSFPGSSIILGHVV